MRRVQRYLLAAIAIAPVLGCGVPSAYKEHIGGTMTRAGAAVGSLRVRFTSSETQQLCGDPYAEAVTDDRGQFQVLLRYQPSWFEYIDVVIHPYRLCVFEDNRWRSVWSLTTGPAPKRVELRCDLAPKGKPACSVTWEGQLVPSFSTSGP